MKRVSLFFGLALDAAEPWARQTASVVGLALALLTAWVMPSTEFVIPEAAWAAVAAVCLITLAAFVVPWAKLPHGWRLLVPLATMLAFGVFRMGTGGPQSLFTSLILLPLIWIATEPGRRNAWLGAITSSVSILMPYLLGVLPWADEQVVRAAFTPLIFLVVATVVNELARRARAQVEVAKALADERAKRLEESRANEAALAASREQHAAAEAFFRSLWEAKLHAVMAVTDNDGTLIEWGPGGDALLGRPRDEVVGTHRFTDLVAPDSLEAIGANGPSGFGRFVEAASSTGSAGLSAEMLRADGTLLTVRLTCSPRHDASGEVVGCIFIAHDITELKEASRLKDEFVGGVSHELRTPLSSILGYLELAQDPESGPLTDEQRKYLGVAERNAHRLLTLVGDLLFVAQVDAGKMPLKRARLDLGDLLDTSIERLLPTAQRASVSLVLERSETPLTIDADPVRLGQAIDNLISNGVKFTPAGGTVRVSARRTDGHVVIAVADTGMGIPADEMKRLFTRFFRATTATRQAVPGVGLGLNITRAIVTAHGGEMSADSVEDEGTTFEIALPVIGSSPGDGPGWGERGTASE
ncbi:hypothetical protein GCM10011490_22770 [Pseudoclavibacter endophyticus]|uniref:histidine kinase n=1 Tax=Pseudoclavibacter endophyticus TaxID=1778590 RepID=A0A6H9WNV7_9MICO|nr:ATP-binding protein [Pseudoclavibacter endophyticus]KAB1648306.1 PAS domain-containing protein [Pseudoclavibacter endophyticus]GGA71512.1 hypothetical protein GCM10011490_22770 [Pseudoclavibacter endophyticus]